MALRQLHTATYRKKVIAALTATEQKVDGTQKTIEQEETGAPISYRTEGGWEADSYRTGWWDNGCTEQKESRTLTATEQDGGTMAVQNKRKVGR